MLELQVRKKTFRIDLVSMYVLEKYDEMQAKAIPLAEKQVKQSLLSADLQELITELRAIAKNPGDNGEKRLSDLKQKIEDSRNEIMKTEHEVRDLSADMLSLRKEIVKEILESNELEYDDEFWHRRTAPEDMNEFLLCCVNKDREPDKKKSSVKKKSLSSTEND